MTGRLSVRRLERLVELHRDHGAVGAYTDHAGAVGVQVPAAVCSLEGLQRQAPSKFPLIGRVDITEVVHQVADHRHAGIRNQRQTLLLLHPEARQLLPGADIAVPPPLGIAIGSQLNEVEGKIIPPGLPPGTDQQGLHGRVFVRVAGNQVALALVPDHPPEGVGNHFPDHPVIAAADRFAVVAAVLQARAEDRVGLDGLPGQPGLNPGAAPAGLQDTHGHLQAVDQVLGKEVGCGRHRGDGLRADPLPAAGRQGVGVEDFLDDQGTQQRQVRPAEFFLLDTGPPLRPVHLARRTAAPDRAHIVFHIGLAGGNPDLADQHVPELLSLPAASHGKGPWRGIGIHRGQHQRPAAVSIGPALDTLPAKTDFHRRAGIRRPPYGDRLVALQDHVVGENAAQVQARLQGARRAQQQDRGGKKDTVDSVFHFYRYNQQFFRIQSRKIRSEICFFPPLSVIKLFFFRAAQAVWIELAEPRPYLDRKA